MQYSQDVKDQIEGLKAAKEFAEAVDRLTKSDDWKKVIQQTYLLEDCASFVHLSVNRGATEGVREAALAQAQAAGYFDEWIRTKIAIGKHAIEELEKVEAEGFQFEDDEVEVI